MLYKPIKILLLWSLLFIPILVEAQCAIKVSGQYCVNNAIQFTGNSSASNHKWDMNGQGTVNNQVVALYSFNSSGTKKIVYSCTIGGQTCKDSIDIFINPLPTVKQYQITSSTDPCRPNSNICIRDSSFSTSSLKITWVQLLIDDGQLLRKNNPSTPQDFCFSYRGLSSNNFFVYSEIVDDSGCINKDTLTVTLAKTVIPRPSYTFNINQSCDSTTLTLFDTSSVKLSDFTSIKWDWGDGNSDNSIKKTNKHTYYIAGNYTATIYTVNRLGCKDTFYVTATVTKGLGDVKMISSKDSVCINGKINFSVDSIPTGVGKVSWILTLPDGTELNMPGSWSQDITFTQLGPQIVRLIYNNLECQKSYMDTILVNGPKVLIEQPYSRVDEREAYQCDVKDYYPIKFPNNTAYYHNDDSMLNDDSSYYDPISGKIKHYFDLSKRTTLKSNPQIRTFNPKCINRIWDFNDKYASACTTFYYQNINRYSNCSYSTQAEPIHVYKSWDIIKNEYYGNREMEEMAFNETLGVCYKRPVYPSDSVILYSDSFISIPASAQDETDYLTLYAGEFAKRYSGKQFKGPGQELITSPVIINIPTGKSLLISDSITKSFYSISGPLSLHLRRNQTIKLITSDAFDFILGRVGDTNYLFKNYWNQYKNSHPYAKRIHALSIDTLAGYDSTFVIDSLLYQNLFQSEIIQCYTVNLREQDTCSILKCQSIDKKTLSIMDPKAGGYRIRPIVSIPYCPIPIPSSSFDLDLSFLKPGCSSPSIFINKDSANPNSKFIFARGRQDSAKYNELGGATTNTSLVYVPNRDSFGYKTVGIIMTNGIGTNFNRPICRDTFWFHNLINFQPPVFGLKLHNPGAKLKNYVQVCKGDDVYYHIEAEEPFDIEKYKGNLYYIESPFTGKYNNQSFQEFLTENMYWRMPLQNPEKHLKFSQHLLTDTLFWPKDSLTKMYSILRDNSIKKYYNYAVITRKITQQKQGPCLNADGFTITETKDTILTGFSTHFDTTIDLSQSRDILKTMAFYKGFEAQSLSDSQLLKMVWNGVGTIDDPSTGSYGCLDTTGRNLASFYKLIPTPGSSFSLHPKDTSMVGYDHKDLGFDTLANGSIRKKYLHSNRFVTKHNTGYLVTSTTNYDNRCFKNDFGIITSGFHHKVHFTDTVLCSAEIESFRFIPEIEYFDGSLPWFYGSESQWADSKRQADYAAGTKNREMPPIWDWNRFDNTSTNVNTFNGTFPYGGIGNILNNKDTIPINRFGSPALYYSSDTGVYLFSSITTDSMGCRDTFSQNIYIIEPQASFKNDFDITNCRNLVTLVDSSFFIEPYLLANNKCANKKKEFIKKWVVDWGDTSSPSVFTKENINDPGFPSSIGHLYKYRGTKTITMTITTENGCESTIVKQVKIPGPEPIFKFVGTDSNIIYLCLGDTAFLRNTTKKATNASQWKWEFGDGIFNNKSDTLLSHIYQTPGRYLIQLTQYDSIFVPPNIRAFCSGTFPADTNLFKMIVIVKDIEPINGRVEEDVLCPREWQTFIDESSPAYSRYSWSVTGPQGFSLAFDTSTKQTRHPFQIPGPYQVIHNATFDPNWPAPQCPDAPDTTTFFLDSVVANFSIDTTLSPKICFTETSSNGVKFHWGFFHNSDILQSGEEFNYDEFTTGKDICKAYESGGKIWICLVAENENGCTDTICKPIELNIFLYIANVFTPGNGDGKNDLYRFLVKGTEEFEVDIYNRWNEHVFHSEDKEYHWNGQVFNTGAEVPDGTYFYIFKYKFRGSKSKLVRGSVMVIRDK